MGPQETICFLRVGGKDFDFFTDYSCGSSMFDASDAFEFHCAMPPGDGTYDDQVRDALNRIQPGAQVEVLVRPAQRNGKWPEAIPQYIGTIDSVDVATTRDGGTMFSVTGRDHMSAVVDSDVLPSIQLKDVTLDEVIRKLLTEPFAGQQAGFYKAGSVIIDNDANRKLLTGVPVKVRKKPKKSLQELQIDSAKAKAGETVYQYLERHCRRFGLMIWGTADGKVVIGQPDYEQEPSYHLHCSRKNPERSNMTPQWKRSFKSRASEIHVFGESRSHDFTSSKIHAVVYDEELRQAGLFRPLTIHDNQARTQDHAEQRARLELSKRLMDANRISAVVQDHVDPETGAVWTIDTIATVTWDDAGLMEAPRHIVKRTFTRSREGGTMTRLELTPLNAIVLGEVQYLPPKNTTGSVSTTLSGGGNGPANFVGETRSQLPSGATNLKWRT